MSAAPDRVNESEASSNRSYQATRSDVLTMIPQSAVVVPLHHEIFCGHRNPTTNKPCRRAEGHTGRHAFIWRFCFPGLVREVWR